LQLKKNEFSIFGFLIRLLVLVAVANHNQIFVFYDAQIEDLNYTKLNFLFLLLHLL